MRKITNLCKLKNLKLQQFSQIYYQEISQLHSKNFCEMVSICSLLINSLFHNPLTTLVILFLNSCLIFKFYKWHIAILLKISSHVLATTITVYKDITLIRVDTLGHMELVTRGQLVQSEAVGICWSSRLASQLLSAVAVSKYYYMFIITHSLLYNTIIYLSKTEQRHTFAYHS